ncbi:MAG: cytochrome-c peroxidase [endosymbiont of Galathealinum brachiosum]|uniref:Cytochrome-c peroxidase n=1 Tax=endosymbiont of Galathealinum brachiosum TaxID=2200906 RepID=A0A370DBQ4_9GAMM|nr:MAG: cytochrome-c peroxidase [endosymbiont of Galathealinum brachiosum]
MKKITGFTPAFTLGFILIFTNSAFADKTDRLMRSANRYFSPLPASMPGAENDTPARIALGKKLFFDKRLSINDTQACASCHELENGMAGVDNLSTSPGAKGEFGTRNSPTVLNAGWQDSQFWDGRAKDLVEQAKGPILNPVEMGMPDEQTVEKKIRGITEYQKLFSSVYPKDKPAITYQNIAEAIAAFERTLITPSRFDDFMNGDASALNQSEQRGLKSFIKLDCKSCHDGKLLGGETYETLGKENPYENQSDTGLFALTGDEDDRLTFKVASLRNVALTAPYFHDGKIEKLNDAVKEMAYLQLDKKLTDSQVEDIVLFLQALTDKKREFKSKAHKK